MSLNKKKLHLLVIIQSPDWGGAEEWITNLVDDWVTRGHVVTGYSNSTELRNKWKKSGASVHKLSTSLDLSGNKRGLIKAVIYIPYAMLEYINILSWAKKNKIDLVVMSNFSEKILITLLATLFKIKVLWFEYGPLEQVFKKNFQIPKLLYCLACNIPKRIITISMHSKSNILEKTRLPVEQVNLVNPGIRVTKKKLGSKNEFIIGSLSRVTWEKGQHLLLQAWVLVLNKYPHAKLHIAGRGPYLDSLKKMAYELKISNSVSFLGFIDDKTAFFNQISVFVFPSVWNMEGFGIVNIEALSRGIPVVAFNRAPANEIITNSVGRLADNGNIEDLAKKICELIGNQKIRTKLSINALTLVEKKYNFITQSEKIIKIINEICHE